MKLELVNDIEKVAKKYGFKIATIKGMNDINIKDKSNVQETLFFKLVEDEELIRKQQEIEIALALIDIGGEK